MPKDIAYLKIDFKIDERGILRIIDLGDGFGASAKGFEDIQAHSQIFNDIHAATGAAIATVFGELPYSAMRPESIHIPLVLRQCPPRGDLFPADDLSLGMKNILLYSTICRFAAYAAFDCGKQKNNLLVPPIALIAVEMHKILWHFLLQKHIAPAEYSTVLYWCNDTSPTEIDLSKIDLPHGGFIKIADRSTGGSDDVHYAENEKALRDIIHKLHSDHNSSNEHFKKHMFVIEPAYVTLKPHQGKDYNVTGRAFITLIYDKVTKAMDVKIAAAKWIFPLAALNEGKKQNQILANDKKNTKMLSLTNDELQILSAGILNTYGEAFKAGFTHANLMLHCVDHPRMKQFISCLRPNSSYLVYLNSFYSSDQNSPIPDSLLSSGVNSLVARDQHDSIKTLLNYLSPDCRFFSNMTLDSIMKQICFFFFF